MPFPTEEPSPWACSWVLSLFPEKGSSLEKIYLRRGEGRRRLVNETELEAALQERGFVSIKPEKLSVREQAGLLSSARCVVAPHGAALTNLIFAPRGARLLELFHPQYKNRYYVSVAAACGHHYASVDGQAVECPGSRELEYSVDVAAVVRMIGEAI